MDIDGQFLVAEARRIVARYLVYGDAPQPGDALYERYTTHSGVFVTITVDGTLRGCIGYPYPDRGLGETLADAAVAAATRDPRFEPLSASELDAVSFEVTILEPPHEISTNNIVRDITIGRHGLIAKRAGRSGLLLPQVAVEYGWSAKHFLEQTCIKAGLEPDAWRSPDTRVWRFGGTVFHEKKPATL